MTGDPFELPMVAPVDGGGRCDRCGWRTFRQTVSGIWRHEPCETRAYWARKTMLRAMAYGRGAPWRVPRARTATGCRGCCLCKGQRP